MGLKTDDFNTCLDSGKTTQEVNSDAQAATSAQGQGTPYFVVVNNKNGKTQAVSGAVPFYIKDNPNANIESAIKAVQ